MTNKKGFSLLELLLVLGIIAALIVGAFIIYPKVQTSVQTNRELKNLAAIKANIDSLYTGKSDYTGLNTVSLAQANVFPDDMTSKGNSSISSGGRLIYLPKNVWGGDVTVSMYNTVNYYQITYMNVPIESCIKLAQAALQMFQSVGPYSTNALSRSYVQDNIFTQCTDSNYKAYNGVMTFSTWGNW